MGAMAGYDGDGWEAGGAAALAQSSSAGPRRSPAQPALLRPACTGGPPLAPHREGPSSPGWSMSCARAATMSPNFSSGDSATLCATRLPPGLWAGGLMGYTPTGTVQAPHARSRRLAEAAAVAPHCAGPHPCPPSRAPSHPTQPPSLAHALDEHKGGVRDVGAVRKVVVRNAAVHVRHLAVPQQAAGGG